jgi:hypothetical protein
MESVALMSAGLQYTTEFGDGREPIRPTPRDESVVALERWKVRNAQEQMTL